ncbi:hypothetical protein DEAC_c24350 [Desulfosporosinus acididurans]|uniref:Uncharacterized protein n=1 Tax=Desulfosporosinus acididurans TaxID=476652 RepID=A0A0J1FQM4_9FIRM|nr:hypothetical protein DEAC_c24350 [Desulfosporosinus acididurans]
MVKMKEGVTKLTRTSSPMRISFHPPTDHYCEDLILVDEQICELLAKRKELSNNNPGFPHQDLISDWSQKFGLNEAWLQRIFSAYMIGEEHFLPLIEPTGFLKFVPILKSVAIDNMSYAVTYMKQYTNASIVCVETEVNTSEPFVRLGHASFELFISPEYHCRQDGGCGSRRGMQHSFVVTPSLPDDISGVEFQLTVKPFHENLEYQVVHFKETTVTIK